MTNRKRLIFQAVCILVFFLLIGCGAAGEESSYQDSSATPETANSSNGVSASDYSQIADTPISFDPRWPTTNEELLSVPEKDRWYNAKQQIGSKGTIVGPVVGVYQASGSRGAPIFINIGENYPDPDRAQVVIWGDRASDFADILNLIENDNAWVSVTGKISKYDGVVEINTDDSKTRWHTWIDVE